MSSDNTSASKPVLTMTEYDRFRKAAYNGDVGEVQRILGPVPTDRAALAPYQNRAASFVNDWGGYAGFGPSDRTVLMELCHCGLSPRKGLKPGFGSWEDQARVIEVMVKAVRPEHLNVENPNGKTALDFAKWAEWAGAYEEEKEGKVVWKYQGPQVDAGKKGHIDRVISLLSSRGAVNGSKAAAENAAASQAPSKPAVQNGTHVNGSTIARLGSKAAGR
ncbi:MAG: hypothetical protein AB7G80_06210 [Dongiaceae bacterium]